MKKAEDDNSLILRFYKLAGSDREASITLPQAAVEAVETDLMERTVSPLTVAGNRIRIRVKPYEIKTLKIKF